MKYVLYGKKCYYFLFYIITVLAFFEISSRALLTSELFLKEDCDAAHRLKWVKRHQRGVVEMFYKFDVYSPSRGWAFKPNLENMVYFDNKIFNSNSRGIRGKVEYNYKKPQDKVRILMIGDSYTFGEEVSDNETFSYYLQQMIPNAEILNFGVHGYGHDQMLIYLEEEGLKYKPDIVVLGFMRVDMDRNILSFRDYAKPKFELINGILKLRNSPVPSPEMILKTELWKSKFIDLLNIFYHKLLHRTKLDLKVKEETTNAILEEIARTTRSINAKPIFVYLSDIFPDVSSKETALYEENFFRYWEVQKVHCISVRPYIQTARNEGIRFKEAGHFDSKTNQIIAKVIKDYLVGHNLVGK